MKNTLDNGRVSPGLMLWSVIILALVVLLHVTHIHSNVMLVFTVILVWKISALAIPWVPTNRWLIILFAIIGFSISAWYYGPPIGRDPGVSFLIVLLGLKLLETQTRRDLRIVLFIGYFLVITHFLYANHIWVVGLLFIIVFIITWLMVLLGHVNPTRQLTRDFRLTAKIIIQAIPFALILFFMFPRFAGSLWLFQSSIDQATTGMSDSLSMGSIADLVESDEISFTATFPNQFIPPPSQRYWKGAILWDTDGREWTRGDYLKQSPLSEVSTGNYYEYELELPPMRKNWLFALDTPVNQPANTTLTPDLYLHLNKISSTTQKFDLVSSSQYVNRTITAEQRRRGTAIGENTFTPRLSEFVNQQIELASVDRNFDPEHYINNILEYFNQQPFYYTLRPPLLLGNYPVDEFLFSSRKGFCEHYATSFVTLMRAANVPARVAIGYLGGEHNPLTNQIIVRQHDAHAWAEVWTAEQGWLRLDPTAAVAPERIENTISYGLSLNANGNVRYQLPDMGLFGSLIRESKWVSALVKQKWDRWFVGFDSKRQQILLKNLGLENLTLQSIAILAFLTALLILVCSAFLFFLKEKSKPDLIARLYADYCKKLAAQGITRSENEGPMDFYIRCKHKFPDQTSRLFIITQLYTSLRYGRNQSLSKGENIKEIKQLRTHIKHLKFS